MELTPEEVRVLGSLVEKELATPQQYPLTLLALLSACNQSTSRDPVVSYDEATVESAVTSAKAKGLARFVHPSHGRSVLRYRHELREQLGLDDRQVALLGTLMLRGAQTTGELRARTDRMADVGSVADVEAELAALAGRQEPLVARAPRSPGQKEDRYVHLLGDAPLVAPLPSPRRQGPPPVLSADLAGRIEALEREVADLHAQLRRVLSELGVEELT